LISDTNYLPYGRSYLEPARKIFKQVTLMEDAMLIHRIMRAPEKRIFYINVGTIPPNEVEQFMQKTINQMKKTPYLSDDGQYNLRFNMQNMMEDFYLPVRGGDTSTKIDTTPGLQYDGIQDVEFLQQKMFAALKIPKAYFGYEGDLQGKATLAAEDIRFARTVERIQKIMESELTKIGLVHLYTQGFTGENLTNFEIKLSTPSILFEQEKVALFKEKVDLAEQMKSSGLFSTNFIYEKIFDLSKDVYEEQRDLMREDSKRDFRKAQIENEGNDPAKSGITYGTPHDLASMYGRRSESTPKGGGPFELPTGYSEFDPAKKSDWGQPGPEGGRPRERASRYGTNDGIGGRDPLGQQGMKGGFPSDNEYVNENNVTESVLEQNKESLKNIIFKQTSTEDTDNLLSDTNIKDI